MKSIKALKSIHVNIWDQASNSAAFNPSCIAHIPNSALSVKSLVN